MVDNQTTQIQKYLNRLRGGDDSARADLVNCACERLQKLTRKMLRSHPKVHRWEQTDDVFQNAMIRLHRAMQKAKIESPRHFFNLAALQIRRELIDLSRHYFGPEGLGAKHETEKKEESSGDRLEIGEITRDPHRLGQWSEFHKQVEALPPEEKEIFDLLWYQGMSQTEAATLLGVSERTLQRRWQAARVKIFEALKGELPE
jgi:RNA polymerase sigma-70 factor (ECF subfamily)